MEIQYNGSKFGVEATVFNPTQKGPCKNLIVTAPTTMWTSQEHGHNIPHIRSYAQSEYVEHTIER